MMIDMIDVRVVWLLIDRNRAEKNKKKENNNKNDSKKKEPNS